LKLFQRLKIWKELKHLERKVHETPSPSTYVDLGQVYINLGMTDHTLKVAEDGLRLFPKSDELRKLQKFARKSKLNARIKELRGRLNRAPHPKLYRELASLYLELGDFGAVHGIAEECIRRFPQDSGAYLVLAKARLTNFYRDLSARDGLEAVRNLHKVISLDPGNVKAHLETLLADGLSKKPAPGRADLEIRFHDVETMGRLVNTPVAKDAKPTRVASEEAIGSIRDSLAQLVELTGIRKTAYIKGSKALVKGDIRDGKDSFLRVVRVMAKAAQRVSRRMDIGNFSKGCLDGDFGHICICCYGEVCAAVLCDSGSPVDRIISELQELVAGSLYMSGRSW
jgi:tetratricopeptide (TPR) repeat protein